MGKLAVPSTEMDTVKLFVAESTQRGTVTYDQILEAVSDVEDNISLIDSIIEEFQANNVQILETTEITEATPATEADPLDGLTDAELEQVANDLIEAQIDPTTLEKVEHTMEHTAPLFDLSTVPIDDSVGLYFREMGQQNLLTAEEEVELAKKIEMGRAYEIQEEQEDFDIELLSWDERDDRANVHGMCDAARAHLIRANTRLVVSIAKKYRGRGLQFLDLIQEGNVGLMKAVEKYDYRRETASLRMRHGGFAEAVTRALANHGRTIRIPAHLGGRISKLYQVAQELEQVLGRQPSPEEIAEHMELPAERVRWMLRTSRQPVHLERPVGDESDAELGDFIQDEDSPAPQESVAQNMLTEEISEILDQLTPREARILRLRYGLQDGESRTLKEVGEMFGLSRERIRQLEKEALRKLRHPNFAGHLRQYLN